VVTEPAVRLDYAAAVDDATLEEPDAITDAAALRLLIAAQVGPVRLIDNCAASGTEAHATASHNAASHATASQTAQDSADQAAPPTRKDRVSPCAAA
jgi:hypothetical protein